MAQTGEPASCWRCDEGSGGSPFLAMHQRHGHDQAGYTNVHCLGSDVANISPPHRSRTQANIQHETSATEPFLAAILDFRTIYCLRHTFTSLQSSPTLILRTDQATASKHHHQVHDFQTQIKVLRNVARHSNRLIPSFNSALIFPLSASPASRGVIATDISRHIKRRDRILFPMSIWHCTIGLAKLYCWLPDDVRTRQPGQDEALEIPTISFRQNNR